MRSAVAVVIPPAAILSLYSQAGSNGDADEVVAIKLIIMFYSVIGAVITAFLEWRPGCRE
jgi:hypothetical protein